jgi:hypothetical protein
MSVVMEGMDTVSTTEIGERSRNEIWVCVLGQCKTTYDISQVLPIGKSEGKMEKVLIN